MNRKDRFGKNVFEGGFLGLDNIGVFDRSAVRLKDRMGPASYDRAGDDLVSRGLYLDVPAWSYHVFDMATL